MSVDLTLANLENADLTSAILWLSDLSNSSLRYSDLKFAELQTSVVEDVGIDWHGAYCFQTIRSGPTDDCEEIFEDI